MKMNRSSSIVEYRLGSQFQQLREKLLTDAYADRLERPLAFWALPGDRRLPLALMGRTVRDLLTTSFDDLLATPGVGQKKIATLVALLDRVADQPIEEVPVAESASAQQPTEQLHAPFDVASVSEVKWSQWRAAVARHGLGSQPLGRFAPSLRNLPRVVWSTPLETYVGLTLNEIRQLKTHGEKRVNAVAEVFCHLYHVLSGIDANGPLAVRIVPRFVPRIEQWVLDTLASKTLPSPEEIEKHFIAPLIDQIEIDAGDHIARLAEKRIGLDGGESSVRQTARKLGITRARVYQLLADIGAIISIRWPEGQALAAQLSDRIASETSDPARYAAFFTAVDLFFPGARTASSEARGEGDEAELPIDQRRRAS